MSMQYEDHLDRELDHILAPLGVKRDSGSTPEQRQGEYGNGKRQGSELHITCLYAQEDQRLWRDLWRHLSLLKHPRAGGELCWHEVVLRCHQPVEIEAAAHCRQSSFIILGVSVDLLLAFHGLASDLYQALLSISQEQAPQLVLVMLRPAAWEDEAFIDPLILPRRGTLTTRQHREQIHVEIAQGVRIAILSAC